MRIAVRYGFQRNNNTKSAIDNIHSNFSEIKADENFSEIKVDVQLENKDKD